MNEPSVIVLGSINVDLVVRSSRLPRPGETVIGGEFYQAPGGKGANQAVAAARCANSPVIFVSAIGDDAFGAQILDTLARENLDCRPIVVIPNAMTGVAAILVDDRGENLISVASGANARLDPSVIDRLPQIHFDKAGVFLASLEVPLDTVQTGLRRAREAGLKTVLNPAPAHRDILDFGLLELVDVLTPNEHEAAALTGIDVDSSDKAVDAARKLQTLGCQNVVVTLGRAGAVVVEGRRVSRIPAFDVAAVDATAAGDAFNGALAARLTEVESLESACVWASAAAAISVTRRGAQPSLPRREEVDRLFASGSGPR